MTAEETEVLARFFVGTRLTRLPSSARSRAVLERLAHELESGRRYHEREGEVLGAFHDDIATLRRALVDAGLVDRADGWYWRSGGRVPTA